VIGGNAGRVVSAGTQFGLGTAFLRFSREFERQADLLGSHIMADAGYDPVEMASMFKTIESQGGSGGPQWLSDHPNPGDRYEYITREARELDVRNPIRDSGEFEDVRARLDRMPPAPTTEQAVKNGGAGRTSTTGTTGRNGRLDPDRVAPPSSRYTSYDEDLFRVSVPSNWREIPSGNSVVFAPDGAYERSEAGSVFTHGIEIGSARNDTADLRAATDDLIDSLSRSNPDLGRASGYNRVDIDGRQGLHTTISNVSEATGAQERLALYTVLLDSGDVFFAIGVAPRSTFSSYESTFRRIVGAIRITE
jgi:hypothetical protein